MEIFLYFFPPLLSSKVEFILGFSPSFFFFISACLSFFSPSWFLWRTLAVHGIFSRTQTALGRCVYCGGHLAAGGCWGEASCLENSRLASQRDRCYPGYPETEVGFRAALTARPPCRMAVPSALQSLQQYLFPFS